MREGHCKLIRSHRNDSPASAGNLSRTLRRQQTDLATRSFFSGSHSKPQSHIGASQRLSRVNRKGSCARVKDGSFARGHVYGSAQKGVKESNPAYHRAESRRRVIWLLAGDRKERCNLKAEVPACLQCSGLLRRPVRRFPEPNIRHMLCRLLGFRPGFSFRYLSIRAAGTIIEALLNPEPPASEPVRFGELSHCLLG